MADHCPVCGEHLGPDTLICRDEDPPANPLTHASNLLAAYTRDCTAASTVAAQLREAGYTAHATGDTVELPHDTATALLQALTELKAQLNAAPY
jgi:hypothetical protein